MRPSRSSGSNLSSLLGALTALVAAFAIACGPPVYTFDAAPRDGGCITCGNRCVQLASDPDHCGACDRACPSRPNAMRMCASGLCQSPCAPGFGDCDGDMSNGCETALDSIDHCGACSTRCTAAGEHIAAACVDGQCDTQCAPGFGNCDGTLDNGCETSLDSAANCGACGNRCDPGPQSTSVCTNGRCALQCTSIAASRYEDCDHDAANGCEVNVSTSAANCGACGTNCMGAVCSRDTCTATCAASETRCGDSCVALLTDVDHCGACDSAICPQRAHSQRACAAGACGLACDPGWGDCDAIATNGCETPLDSVSNCRACGAACPAIANGSPRCSSAGCGLACNAGFADCNGILADGCETVLGTDVNNCGRCANGCGVPANGSARCTAGVCQAACAGGFADCDHAYPNGCEVALGTSSNCASCGNACASGQVCGGTSCMLQCPSGQTLCVSACFNLASDVSHCGSCTTACPMAANATRTCNGSCGFTCASGYGDCDGNAASGCETNLNANPAHCGACGRACSSANSTPACSSGVCSIAACRAGFADCDRSPANGCEVSLSDVNNCGACGTRCAFANATPQCNGACSIASCNAGFGNCDGTASNGCETPLSADANNCGACGTRCSFANGNAACSGGACVISSCLPGFYLSAGACITVDPPRLIRPMSTSIVLSATPRLEVQRVGGVPASRIEICSSNDSACSAPIRNIGTGGGVDFVDVSPALPAGIYFWRARGASMGVAGGAYSPTWQFRVAANTSGAINTYNRSELDWRRLGLAVGLVGSTTGPVGDPVIPPNGQVALYRWNGTTMANSSDLNAPAGTGFGSGVANAGDVNGDGLGDILVGNCLGGVPPVGACDRVFVFRGNAGGGPTLMQTITAPAGASGFGYAVAGVGDIDADGYGDIVIGAYGANHAYVFYGSARGAPFDAAPNVDLPAPACNAGLGSCGTMNNPLFGVSIAGFFDFNGDRIADFAIGAPTEWNRVFVYAGGARWSSAPAAQEIRGPVPAAETRNWGLSVGNAGDVNNDGRSDLLVGGNASGGMATIHLGGGGGIFTLNAPGTATANFGVTVAGAGDTNGDGFSDVIVGDSGNGAYVYLGNGSGIALNASRTIAASGTAAFARFVASPGDIDDDGYSDVLINGCQPPMGATCSNTIRFCRGSATGINVAGCQTVGGSGNFGIRIASIRPRVHPTSALLLGL